MVKAKIKPTLLFFLTLFAYATISAQDPKSDTTRYNPASNVISSINIGYHNTFSRVVLNIKDAFFYEIEEDKDRQRLVVMVYNTVIGQPSLISKDKTPFIKEVVAREISKRHTQIIIRIDSPNFTYKYSTLLRPYRLVIDIYPQTAPSKSGSNYDKLLEEGIRLYNQQKYDEALAKFRVAAMEGNLTAAYYYAGLIRFKQKQYPQAIYNFSLALHKEKEFSDAYQYLSRIEEEKRDYKKAIEYLDLYFKNSRDSVSFTELKTHRQYLQDIVDRLIKTDTQAIVDTSLDSAQIAMQQAQIDTFFLDYGVKLSFNEETAQKWMTYANSHIENQNYDKAIRTLAALLKLYPQSVFSSDARFLLAKLYFSLHLYPQSEDYTRALYDQNLLPELKNQILYMRAISLYHLKRPLDAEKLIKEFIQTYPDDERLYRLYRYQAALYEGKNNPILRDEAYQMALRLVPDQEEALDLYRELLDLFLNKKEYSKAQIYCQAIINLFDTSKDPLLLNNRHIEYAFMIHGDIAFQLENWEAASNRYSKVIELYLREYPEKLDWPYFQLGNLAKRNRDYTQARSYYQTVLERYPNSIWRPQAEYQLSDLDWLEKIEPKLEELRREEDGSH